MITAHAYANMMPSATPRSLCSACTIRPTKALRNHRGCLCSPGETSIDNTRKPVLSLELGLEPCLSVPVSLALPASHCSNQRSGPQAQMKLLYTSLIKCGSFDKHPCRYHIVHMTCICPSFCEHSEIIFQTASVPDAAAGADISSDPRQ